MWKSGNRGERNRTRAGEIDLELGNNWNPIRSVHPHTVFSRPFPDFHIETSVPKFAVRSSVLEFQIHPFRSDSVPLGFLISTFKIRIHFRFPSRSRVPEFQINSLPSAGSIRRSGTPHRCGASSGLLRRCSKRSRRISPSPLVRDTATQPRLHSDRSSHRRQRLDP